MDNSEKIKELEAKLVQLERTRQINTDNEDMLNQLWRDRNGAGNTGARVSAYASNSQTVTTSWITINFNTEDYDLKNEQSGDTFTASENGYYYISATVNIKNVLGDYLGYVEIRKTSGGTNYTIDNQSYSPGAASFTFGAKVSADVFLLAGDTIKIRTAMGTTGVSLGTETGRGNTFICIHKI